MDLPPLWICTWRYLEYEFVSRKMGTSTCFDGVMSHFLRYWVSRVLNVHLVISDFSLGWLRGSGAPPRTCRTIFNACFHYTSGVAMLMWKSPLRALTPLHIWHGEPMRGSRTEEDGASESQDQVECSDQSPLRSVLLDAPNHLCELSLFS